MEYYGIDREQMLKLAGIEYRPQMYTPATVGKKNKIIPFPSKHWGNQFRNLNFTTREELKNIQSETVTAMPIFFKDQNGNFIEITDKRAIVGDVTNESYAVHSDKYEPVQNNVIINAMYNATCDTDLSVFGHLADDGKGRFNGYGTFANPDCHINLGEAQEDPVMLGMRFFNSHLGDSRFGGEIFGIRAVCGNYMAWGEVLGKVSILHFKSEEDVADSLAKVMMEYVDKIDALKDKVHYIRDMPVDVVEQESILWGIGMNPVQIENILSHKTELNPDFKGSVWDVYNSATAFVTYKVGSSHTEGLNLRMSDKIQQMLVNNIDSLIAQGEKRKSKYYEETANAQTQKVIVRAVA